MERPPHFPDTSDQRTLFLVNTFVIHTVRLLNNFAVICEAKLAEVHRRILRADATLSLLEAKLRSVDALEGIDEHIGLDPQPDQDLVFAPGTPRSSGPDQSPQSPEALPFSSAQSDLSIVDSFALVPTLDQAQYLKGKDDPKFTRFFKMLQVGVPLAAVKMQMSLEGLDGSVLDNPEEQYSE